MVVGCRPRTAAGICAPGGAMVSCVMVTVSRRWSRDIDDFCRGFDSLFAGTTTLETGEEGWFARRYDSLLVSAAVGHGGGWSFS